MDFLFEITHVFFLSNSLWSRFIADFNRIYEFITTGFFLWAIFAMCISCLLLQMQLLEYFPFGISSAIYNQISLLLIFYNFFSSSRQMHRIYSRLLYHLCCFHGQWFSVNAFGTYYRSVDRKCWWLLCQILNNLQLFVASDMSCVHEQFLCRYFFIWFFFLKALKFHSFFFV